MRTFRFPSLAGAAAVTCLLAGAAPALEPGEFDPSPLDSLLIRYVTPAGVDYAGWRAGGLEPLRAFLDSGSDYDLTKVLGKEPRAGFLINAYNAWAVLQILEHPDASGPQDIPGFYDANRRRVAGKDRSLNEIEAELAAVLSHRPDYFFALAPGADDLPALESRAWVSEGFLDRLRAAGTAYLRDAHRPTYDRESNTLHLPPAFHGRAAGFDKLPQGLTGFLADHMPLADLVAFAKANPKVVTAPARGKLRLAAPASGDRDEAK
jgi:hypothetical protein